MRSARFARVRRMESNRMDSGTGRLTVGDASWRAALLGWHANKRCEIQVTFCMKFSNPIMSLQTDIAARMFGPSPPHCIR